MSLYFRHAVLEDAAACAEIYRPYVEKTSITAGRGRNCPTYGMLYARIPVDCGADWENGDRLCLWVSAKYQGGLPMECGFGDLSV